MKEGGSLGKAAGMAVIEVSSLDVASCCRGVGDH